MSLFSIFKTKPVVKNGDKKSKVGSSYPIRSSRSSSISYDDIPSASVVDDVIMPLMHMQSLHGHDSVHETHHDNTPSTPSYEAPSESSYDSSSFSDSGGDSGGGGCD